MKYYIKHQTTDEILMGFLDPVSTWGGVSPIPTDNSQTAAGYPRIQLNSDTIHQKTASDSGDEGFSPTRLPRHAHISDARLTPLLLPVLTTDRP